MRSVRQKNIALVVAMLQRRMSNRALARAAGVDENHLSNIINRRHDPKPETRIRIARALGCTTADLFPPEVTGHE